MIDTATIQEPRRVAGTVRALVRCQAWYRCPIKDCNARRPHPRGYCCDSGRCGSIGRIVECRPIRTPNDRLQRPGAAGVNDGN